MEKFRDKYRNKSNRAEWWDYRNEGAYFVTICTKNRAHYFGEIIKGEMILSEIGKIVEECWQGIVDHFDDVELAEFVVMPNHFHGVTLLRNQNPVGALHATHLQDNRSKNERMADISPKKGSLSVVVRSFKSAVTNKSRKIDPKFAWQANYHDRIIRDYEEYQRIAEYIFNNSKNWNLDRFYK